MKRVPSLELSTHEQPQVVYTNQDVQMHPEVALGVPCRYRALLDCMSCLVVVLCCQSLLGTVLLSIPLATLQQCSHFVFTIANLHCPHAPKAA